ncbi:MAG: hypothetical protein ACE5KM_02075 [Planctomycetaceae bacterium]
MSTYRRTTSRWWLFASAIGMCLGGSWSSTAIAQQPDIDKMTGRDIRYFTKDAMYLANEQWLLFACDLPAGQTDIGSNFNKDSYWYSRYNLGNLLMRSGMGIHMVHNPLFKQHSQNDRKPDGSKMFPTPKDFMVFKIRQFCARTGVPCRFDPGHKDDPKAFPPKGVHPVFLEYASGSPRFQQPPVPSDFNTLRWDPKSIDHTINPGAVGQALVKEVLWSEDFFANHRKGPNGEVWLGNKKEYGNGFRGAALTAMAITKMFALKSTLAYDPQTGKLGDVGDPAKYNPMKGLRYYPHAIRPKFMKKPGMPPMPVSWQVADKSSHLSDQASLLWGASEFYFYSDPKVKDSFDVVFGDQGDHKTHGALFPLKPHMLSKGLSVVAFKNMMAMHFDMKHGTFRGVAWPKKSQRVVVVTADRADVKSGTSVVGSVTKGQALPVYWERSDWIGVEYADKSGRTVKGWIRPNNVADVTTADAGLALVALANLKRRLQDAPPPLLKKVKMAATAQGRFLRDKLRASDGGFYNGYVFGSGANRSTRSLKSQGLGIRGLLAAYAITGDSSFKTAAEETFAYMNEKLWSTVAGSYRSEEGAMESVYTPQNVGATMGALRELALSRSGAGRKQVVAKIDKFFAATQTQHRQQLAEIGPTGEPIPPMDQMKAMKAKLMALMKTNPSRAKAMKLKMADIDGDGVPKPGMAGGKFGFAPVPAFKVKVATR